MHELEVLLSRLKMEHLSYHVESLLEQAAKKELNYREFLCMALQQEWNGRHQRGMESRLKQARLPWVKTLEQFDFTFQPGIDRKVVRELAGLAFVERSENVILLGPPGVNTLGFSRSFHVFAAPKQDAEHTYESLVRAFRYFGGCVKTVLVDNQKAAVLKNNNGKVVFNSGFLLLADHYNFLPRACRPRRARTKGKVERMVKYLKENFFVRYRRFDSFTHVNQQLEQWIADVADKRELRQFKETPEQRFALEQEHLQPLPDTDFDTSYFDIRHVSWDSYIEVGGNRYSVPEALCGQPVSIRISLDDELRIYSNEKLVASHRLCSASSGWQTVPEHHAPLWQQVSQVEHRPLSAYEELL
ncbi:IS21 family transposase [Shigella sonnei]|nr:IS21 family transposase [Shigella sonnei]SRR30247.1 integrase for IS21, orfA [Shigella sonnei]